MNVMSFESDKKYYLSTCPVCAGTALETDIMPRKVEFQCGLCGAYEITATARSAMKGLSQEYRELWLWEARQQAADMHHIALVACANETPRLQTDRSQ